MYGIYCYRYIFHVVYTLPAPHFSLFLSLCFLSFPRAALSTHNGYICMFIGFHIYIISSAMFGNNTHHNKNGQVISPEQQDVKTEKLNLP